MATVATAKLDAFGIAGPHPVWYHGQCSRGLAEQRLMGTPEGTFLVRDSSSNPGDFVLSCSEAARVSHYIIQRRPGRTYFIGDQTFTDIVEILEFYKSHLLDTTTLGVPLPLDSKIQNGVLSPVYLCSVTAVYNFNARDVEDLSFRVGDRLNILEKHEKNWWRAQSHKSLQIGVIPANYVEEDKLPELEADPVYGDESDFAGSGKKGLQRSESVMDPERQATRRELPPLPEDTPKPSLPPRSADPAPSLPPARKPAAPPPRVATPPPLVMPEVRDPANDLPPRMPFRVVRAILDRVANAYDSTALSFRTGDVIHIHKQHENGLWEGAIVGGDGKVGHFPFTLVELIDSGEYDADLQQLEVQYEAQMDEIYGTA